MSDGGGVKEISKAMIESNTFFGACAGLLASSIIVFGICCTGYPEGRKICFACILFFMANTFLAALCKAGKKAIAARNARKSGLSAI